MDRNFLYCVVAFLGIALGLVYTQKKNPDFFANLTGSKNQVESWRKDDPGWKNDFPNTGPAPVAPAEPKVEPRVEPTPPQPQPQPKTQPGQPPRRLQPRQQPQNECPPNG